MEAKEPLLRTPLTDFQTILGIMDVQLGGPKLCRKMELRYYDCVEAYGADTGLLKCRDYYNDFYECMNNDKKKWRQIEMKKEREKQFKNGTRDKRYFESPAPDLFFLPEL